MCCGSAQGQALRLQAARGSAAQLPDSRAKIPAAFPFPCSGQGLARCTASQRDLRNAGAGHLRPPPCPRRLFDGKSCGPEGCACPNLRCSSSARRGRRSRNSRPGALPRTPVQKIHLRGPGGRWRTAAAAGAGGQPRRRNQAHAAGPCPGGRSWPGCSPRKRRAVRPGFEPLADHAAYLAWSRRRWIMHMSAEQAAVIRQAGLNAPDPRHGRGRGTVMTSRRKVTNTAVRQPDRTQLSHRPDTLSPVTGIVSLPAGSSCCRSEVPSAPYSQIYRRPGGGRVAALFSRPSPGR